MADSDSIKLCECGCGTAITSSNPNTKFLRGHQFKTHGHSRRSVGASATYRAWAAMRTRCNNPNAINFNNYGGRGISVCDRWSTFANFLADMGEKPENRTLDRIDNNGNYEPGNCRWATRLQQNRNRRPISIDPHRFPCGHDRTEENSYHPPKRRHHVPRCRTCHLARGAAWRAINRPRKPPCSVCGRVRCQNGRR